MVTLPPKMLYFDIQLQFFIYILLPFALLGEIKLKRSTHLARWPLEQILDLLPKS